jgi:hypothetical protein
MSNTVQANPRALVESVARILPPGAQDDFRNLMNETVLANLTALSPGGNLIQPGGAASGSSAPPQGVKFSVSGANGVFSVNITDPSTAKPNTIWHEVSYGPLISFTSGVTTMAATANSTASVAAPGVSAYFRLRSSFDKQTWSAYQLASTSIIDAGLVVAKTMAPAAAFNQTNYAVVNSQASGSAAAVTVSGTGGDFTAYTAVLGGAESVMPSATIVNVPPETEQFVAVTGDPVFQLKPTLASCFADGLTPVGKVSVVSTAIPTLPTIAPVVVSGYIIGFNIISGGAGASEPYNLAFGSVGAGAGASFGAQTITNGVLTFIAPGAPGNGLYSGGTTVTASGGAGGGGQSGGGTAQGGNGGRLTAV